MASIDPESITNKIINQLNGFNQEFADIFVERVKQNTPVRTGVLQAGWEAEVDATSITIFNEVPYASFVEDGTPFQRPQGMLARTIEEADLIVSEILKSSN